VPIGNELLKRSKRVSCKGCFLQPLAIGTLHCSCAG
jgi:hypothetical protein